MKIEISADKDRKILINGREIHGVTSVHLDLSLRPVEIEITKLVMDSQFNYLLNEYGGIKTEIIKTRINSFSFEAIAEGVDNESN